MAVIVSEARARGMVPPPRKTPALSAGGWATGPRRSQMEKQIEIVHDYSLNVRGVYGRNRTEKFQTIKLKRLPEDAEPLDERALLTMATIELDGMKLKTGRWTVTRRVVEVEQYSDGVKIERWALYTGQTTLLQGGK